MQKIFSFDVDLCPAGVFAEALGVVEGSRPSGVVIQKVLELRLKFRVAPGFEICLLELFERGHQDFGHVAAAVRSEMAAGIWLGGRHECSAAFTNRLTLS